MDYFPTLNQLWGDYPLTFAQMIQKDIGFCFFIYSMLIIGVVFLAFIFNDNETLSS